MKFIKNSFKNNVYLLITAIITFIILLSGCSNFNQDNNSNKAPYITKSSFLLNTVVTITIYDMQKEALIDECFELISKYELVYSRTNPKSELYKLNNRSIPQDGSGYEISSEMLALLEYGLYYSSLSKGAFDITIAPVSSLWDFTGTTPVKPTDEAINQALAYVNYEAVKIDGNKVFFANENVNMDFGAIAKGYIADRVKEYLLSQGVQSALINLGGNVHTIGNKPDGSPFLVGIQKPYADRNETIAVIEIEDLSVVSSGIYERFFTLDGIGYHHILNPKTGYPYDNGLISITIISKDSVDGDGLSTTCFALGLEEGLKLINSIPDTYGIFITDDYKIYYSDGLLENFKLIQQ
ncbi:MAG: FAD:protein FMN transferase [Clostridiales bacterium]|nr:FAD:protein FMN transferase [Clostridiales bacterium]